MPTDKKTAEKKVEKTNFIQKIKSKIAKKDGAKSIDRSGLWAKIGFTLGLVSIIAWLVPLAGVILGLVVTICGIVFSALGLRADKGRWFAVVGLTLSILFLNLTLLMGFYNILISMLSNSGL